MTLTQKQATFTVMIAKLILWADGQGLQLTFGQAYQTPAQVENDMQAGKGIRNRLYSLRLAIDLNLFIDGVYQTATTAYKPLGQYWQAMGGAWGGDFKACPDGNHFSLLYSGIK
ncbi:M15 family metallopeptidase [Utexia brackfieldae]|uniref:M15 family metallopeptidase n=1 Tax=Utexia brackfieldae TaxID=3074108 RepID=UPI00370D63AB